MPDIRELLAPPKSKTQGVSREDRRINTREDQASRAKRNTRTVINEIKTEYHEHHQHKNL